MVSASAAAACDDAAVAFCFIMTRSMAFFLINGEWSFAT